MLKNRIKTLIDLIENTEVQEIEVSSFWGVQKIKLNKGSDVKSKVVIEKELPAESEVKKEVLGVESSPKEKSDFSTLESSDEKQEIKSKELKSSQNFYEIKAPLVGTYYSSPKPDDPPFVSIGDQITKGQTLCIIEAMKIFNEIESEISGTVADICIETGKPVEFDQLILKIIPE